MPYRTQSERHHPYFVEVEGEIAPTPEELERGKRLAQGFAQINRGLFELDTEDQHFDITWSSLNDARIVVLPNFPIKREVVRGDSFYEYTSPHEITKSTKQIVISSFELIKPEYHQKPSRSPLIRGRSPGYRTYELPLAEVSFFDPSRHQIALHNRKRNSRTASS